MNNTINHIALILMCLFAMPSIATAQKFEPERINADRAQFITREAGMCSADSAIFFDFFDEMQEKKREVHCQMKAMPRHEMMSDDSCRQVILERDSLEMQMKKVEQCYHEKMLQVLKPSLVFRALKAEADFCRQAFRRVAKKMKD